VNVDRILEAFARHDVACLLIGGMNFLLRHQPVLTFDIDFWIEDTSENALRCERALAELGAEWGATDQDWRPVALRPTGWLSAQMVFCLTSPHGPIDIFRAVRGLGDWQAAAARALRAHTAAGVPYLGLSDEDMLPADWTWTNTTASRNACERCAKPSSASIMSDEQKHQEEARRECHWDARQRWKTLQETITWVEAQPTVRRNTRVARLAQQSRQNVR
jgi:hypothetical protein